MPVIINTGGFGKNSQAQEFDTGFFNFNSFASIPFGSKVWTSPSNARTLNFAPARTAARAVLISHYLRATGINTPALPPAAIINGIQVRHSSTRFNLAFENSVRLFQGGSPVGSDRSNGSLFAVFFGSYLPINGGSSDLWGIGPLSGADVNSSTFGVGMACIMFGRSRAFRFVIADCDNIQMRIFYTSFT